MEQESVNLIAHRFESIERRIMEAFEKIRQEMLAHNQRIDKMSDFVKQRDKEVFAARDEQKALLDQLQSQVEEFEKRMSQLRIALTSVKSLKNELVVSRDLIKIEERVKDSFKREVDRYKDQVKILKQERKDEQKYLRSLERRLEKLESGFDKVKANGAVGKVVYAKPSKKVKKTKKSKSKKSKPLPESVRLSERKGWSFFSNFEFE